MSETTFSDLEEIEAESQAKFIKLSEQLGMAASEFARDGDLDNARGGMTVFLAGHVGHTLLLRGLLPAGEESPDSAIPAGRYEVRHVHPDNTVDISIPGADERLRTAFGYLLPATPEDVAAVQREATPAVA